VEVQIFGVKKSADTRKALRFFAERRVRVHFVDLSERAASRGELMRFVQRFGIVALVDKESRRYLELGLGGSIRNEANWLVLVAEEPLLLRMPLVRTGNALTIGLAESKWTEWTRGK